jgi:SAM-dependent methyltransferase
MLVDQIKYNAEQYDPNQHPGNIDQLTVERVPQGARVLDIGCATGYIGAWLQKERGCTVVGVEFSPTQAEVAKTRLDQVFVGNIESDALQEQICQLPPFDVVLSSATIVCLVDPWKFLRKTINWIAPGGKLLITCANVAHWTIRRDLLRGKWDYQAYGVLDEIALRFFTVHSFRRSLEQAGYRVTGFDAEFYDGGPRVVLRRLAMRRLEQWYVRRFANIFAIQFVYEAVPGSQA